MSRTSIALGPLTINNTRGGRSVIALVAALLLALVVLAVYGGINLIMVDDSPESSQDDSTRHAVKALNVSEVKRVVPDLTSMPSGWSCPTAALTAKFFEELRSNVADNNKATEISFPELGDQRAAITHYDVAVQRGSTASARPMRRSARARAVPPPAAAL
ncbi:MULTISPECIES: hypothetical protein [Streptomyces]|uniref:hypothetical protein n=1 Tax=Streptomyces lycopersici TaxID=2974589 RepID=UPI0021D1BAA6|nr:hypothetical protein [Streptomyces sp. NEAU-383]